MQLLDSFSVGLRLEDGNVTAFTNPRDPWMEDILQQYCERNDVTDEVRVTCGLGGAMYVMGQCKAQEEVLQSLRSLAQLGVQRLGVVKGWLDSYPVDVMVGEAFDEIANEYGSSLQYKAGLIQIATIEVPENSDTSHCDWYGVIGNRAQEYFVITLLGWPTNLPFSESVNKILQAVATEVLDTCLKGRGIHAAFD
ncbi:MAG: hypothetical protein ABIA47_03355 [bacterium]